LCFEFVFYDFQGKPDLISGVRIDIMTEKTNEGSDQGNPCLLEGKLLSLVGFLNLLMLFLTM
jgi:hypothetical protein